MIYSDRNLYFQQVKHKSHTFEVSEKVYRSHYLLWSYFSRNCIAAEVYFFVYENAPRRLKL